MNILLCFGTRPEAIKMSPVIRELKRQGLRFKVCVTAQHREMLDQVLDFFEIIPDYDLNLMMPGQSLNSLSSRIIKEIDNVFEESKPDILLVQGDTTTAFMVALAAFQRNIKIGHIEAGLRTGNLRSPFPEEANRQLLSRVADFNFVPTSSCRHNLLEESIREDKIIITGNTVIDALESGESRLNNGYTNNEIKALKSIIKNDKKMVLVTGHRRENLGKNLEEICKALLRIAERKDVQIIFPVHLNPMVKKQVFELLGSNQNIHLIEPVNYPAFIWLMLNANLIISDSGGVQEEAPSLKKPVIVTRDTTERQEGIEAGFSFLTGTGKRKIIEAAFRLLDFAPDYSETNNPFGDGLASKRIVDFLKDHEN